MEENYVLENTAGGSAHDEGAFERFLTAAIAAIITIMFSWRLLTDVNDAEFPTMALPAPPRRDASEPVEDGRDDEGIAHQPSEVGEEAPTVGRWPGEPAGDSGSEGLCSSREDGAPLLAGDHEDLQPPDYSSADDDDESLEQSFDSDDDVYYRYGLEPIEEEDSEDFSTNSDETVDYEVTGYFIPIGYDSPTFNDGEDKHLDLDTVVSYGDGGEITTSSNHVTSASRADALNEATSPFVDENVEVNASEGELAPKFPIQTACVDDFIDNEYSDESNESVVTVIANQRSPSKDATAGVVRSQYHTFADLTDPTLQSLNYSKKPSTSIQDDLVRPFPFGDECDPKIFASNRFSLQRERSYSDGDSLKNEDAWITDNTTKGEKSAFIEILDSLRSDKEIFLRGKSLELTEDEFIILQGGYTGTPDQFPDVRFSGEYFFPHYSDAAMSDGTEDPPFGFIFSQIEEIYTDHKVRNYFVEKASGQNNIPNEDKAHNKLDIKELATSSINEHFSLGEDGGYLVLSGNYFKNCDPNLSTEDYLATKTNRVEQIKESKREVEETTLSLDAENFNDQVCLANSSVNTRDENCLMMTECAENDFLNAATDGGEVSQISMHQPPWINQENSVTQVLDSSGDKQKVDDFHEINQGTRTNETASKDDLKGNEFIKVSNSEKPSVRLGSSVYDNHNISISEDAKKNCEHPENERTSNNERFSTEAESQSPLEHDSCAKLPDGSVVRERAELPSDFKNSLNITPGRKVASRKISPPTKEYKSVLQREVSTAPHRDTRCLPERIVPKIRKKITARRFQYFSEEDLLDDSNHTQEKFDKYKTSSLKVKKYRNAQSNFSAPPSRLRSSLSVDHISQLYSRKSQERKSFSSRPNIHELHSDCIFSPSKLQEIRNITASFDDLQGCLTRCSSVCSLVETDLDTMETVEHELVFSDSNDSDVPFQFQHSFGRSMSMMDLQSTQNARHPSKSRFADRHVPKSKSMQTLETNLDDDDDLFGSEAGFTRQPSIHELRISRSLQKLNVPTWFKNSSVSRSGSCILRRDSDSMRSDFSFTPSLASSPASSMFGQHAPVVIKTRVMPSSIRLLTSPKPVTPTMRQPPKPKNVALPSDKFRKREKSAELMPIPIVPFSKLREMFEKKAKTQADAAPRTPTKLESIKRSPVVHFENEALKKGSGSHGLAPSLRIEPPIEENEDEDSAQEIEEAAVSNEQAAKNTAVNGSDYFDEMKTKAEDSELNGAYAEARFVQKGRTFRIAETPTLVKPTPVKVISEPTAAAPVSTRKENFQLVAPELKLAKNESNSHEIDAAEQNTEPTVEKPLDRAGKEKSSSSFLKGKERMTKLFSKQSSKSTAQQSQSPLPSNRPRISFFRSRKGKSDEISVYTPIAPIPNSYIGFRSEDPFFFDFLQKQPYEPSSCSESAEEKRALSVLPYKYNFRAAWQRDKHSPGRDNTDFIKHLKELNKNEVEIEVRGGNHESCDKCLSATDASLEEVLEGLLALRN